MCLAILKRQEVCAMSIALGIRDLAMFLAEKDLDPEEIEEFEEVYRQLNRFLTARGYLDRMSLP
jgi:hypothetical protein